ncbi:MAG TPA: large conductance mechanosensitive channel protein MscL [Anaerolineae bacterium]
MLKEFQEFAFKGSLLDLAIGLILGSAFGKVVASLVTDVLMPPLGLLLGRVDFANLFINLSDKTYTTLADARAAGAPAIGFGVFLNTVITFVVLAIVLFFVIRPFNRAKEEKEDKEMTDKAKEELQERGKEKGGEAGGEAEAGSAEAVGTSEPD